MPITFSDFQSAVAERIQDAAGKLAFASIDGCIREALVGRYSQARPLLQITDFTGDGHTYEWEISTDNFPGWIANFSSIADLEYPAGDRDPSILEKDEWRIYRPSSGTANLRLVQIVPGNGQILRVRYTAPHADDGSTVPEADFYGVVNLASSLAAWRLHALYNQLGDSAVGGDAVDYHSKSAEYRLLSQDLEKAFKVAFGLDKDEPQPAASRTAEWSPNSESGGRKLTH